MKRLLIISLLSALVFTCCKKDIEEEYEPFYGSAHQGTVVVFLKDSNGNNLLEAITQHCISEEDISVDYKNPSFRAKSLLAHSYSGHRDFSIDETKNGLALCVYLELPNSLKMPKGEGTSFQETYTYIRFGKGPKNAIRTLFQVHIGHQDADDLFNTIYGNSSCLIKEIYFNNELMWSEEDPETDRVIVLNL